MLRIVKEVDNIAKNPELASDEEHLPPFMSAELFKAMLPVPRPRDGGHRMRGGGGCSGGGVEERLEEDEEEVVFVAHGPKGYGEYSKGEERVPVQEHEEKL